MIAFELDEQIDAYEAALVAGRAGAGDIERFLPAPEDTQRVHVLIELLRVTLEHEWRPGQTEQLGSLLDRFPELKSDAAFIEPLAYEEYRLRVADGQRVDRQTYAARYGVDVATWQELSPESAPPGKVSPDGSSALWNEFSLSAPASAAAMAVARRRLPEVGERFGPFCLIAVLGQGAFGKVFLARQATLANRHVAFKITAGPTGEAERLARLQHSNVVPIYSVHRRGRLSGVCMPYLGGVTLADLLAKIRRESRLPNSAQSLVDTVAARQAELSTVIQPRTEEPAVAPEVRPAPQADRTLKQLAARNWEEAICWIVSGVAEGLSHAHQRDIIHRDLKPANILISDDGAPLVLDFNLATDRSLEAGHLARIGGTLPYMSPEQFRSFQGDSVEISTASDVYSLGVVLYESLTGRLPFPIRQGTLDQVVAQMLQERCEGPLHGIRRLNPAVSPGLAAIVAKCMQPEPAARYRDAGELREDLQRHLEHRPLRYAKERSLTEVVQKWRKRHPRLASATSVAVIALLVAGVFGSIWRGREQLHAKQAEQHAAQAAEQTFERFHSAIPTSRTLLILANPDSPEERDGLAAAKDLLAAYRVQGNPQWQSLPEVRRLSARSQSELTADIADLTHLLTRRESATDKPAKSTQSSPLTNEAREVPDRRNSTERLIQLHRSVQEGRGGAESIRALDEFTRTHPQDVASWLVLGDCRRIAGDYSGAEQACTAAIALRSDLYLTWYWRGIVLLQHERPKEAEADFTEALKLRPDFPGGWANRGVARKLQGQYTPAIEDLTKAVDSGLQDSLVYFSRAQCYKALGEAENAKRDFELGTKLQSQHAQRWFSRGMAHLELNDYRTAEQDFIAALKIAPGFVVARRNLAHVQSEKLAKLDEAIETLNGILKLQPNDLSARISRGVLYARQNKKTEALQDAEATLQRNPPAHELCQAASLFALLSKDDSGLRNRALDYLEQSVAKQPKLAAVVESDPDMANLRLEPRFIKLMSPQPPESGNGTSKAN